MVDVLKITVAVGGYDDAAATKLCEALDQKSGWSVVYTHDREGVMVFHCVATPPSTETHDMEGFCRELATRLCDYSP